MSDLVCINSCACIRFKQRYPLGRSAPRVPFELQTRLLFALSLESPRTGRIPSAAVAILLLFYLYIEWILLPVVSRFPINGGGSQTLNLNLYIYEVRAGKRELPTPAKSI